MTGLLTSTNYPIAISLLGTPVMRGFGAPGEIRTPDLVVRSHALYPTELRARRAVVYPQPHFLVRVDLVFRTHCPNESRLSQWIDDPV